jgi:hypothetical protein
MEDIIPLFRRFFQLVSVLVNMHALKRFCCKFSSFYSSVELFEV